MFKLKIDTGNSAFGESHHDRVAEVERILLEVCKDMHHRVSGNCRDINGNKVGEWGLT